MKKNRAFFVCLLVLWLVLISGGFAAGYLLVQSSFAVPQEIAAYVTMIRAEREQASKNVVKEEKKETIRPTRERCDVYVLLGEDGNLQNVMAGYLDAGNGNAMLVTVPLDAYLDLPEELYRELAAEFPTIPQVFELGVLTSYVGEERIGATIKRIFEGFEIAKFTESWTVRAKSVQGWLTQRDGVIQLSEQTKTWMQLDMAQKKTLLCLEDFVTADADVTGRKNVNGLSAHAEVIAALQPWDVTTERAAGTQQNEHYRLNLVKMAQQLSVLHTVLNVE